jgi:putative inorganic carbon (hco3(-)) transporter
LSVEEESYHLSHKSNYSLYCVIGLGCAVGFGVFFLVEKELRWVLAPVLALAGLIFIILVPAKKKVLTAVFILSFQINVILRLFYGYSGSKEGIGLPLVVVTGFLLVGWYLTSGNAKQICWGGSMRTPILVLFITVFLSVVASSEKFVGITAIVYFLQYYFLYLVALNIVRSREDFRQIVILLLVVLALQSLVYFVQSLLGVTFDFLGNVAEEGSVPRPGGTVSTNPDGFVSFVMPALMVASALALAKKRPLLSQFPLLAMLMGLAAVGLSFTRAAWVGVVLGFLIIVYFGARNRWINVRMVLAVASIAALGVIPLLPKMFDRVSSDYGAGGVDGTIESLNERMGLNLIAINIISHNPITGVGIGAYSYVFKGYVPSGMNQWLFTVHNQYLLQAAETGIPGGIAFIVILISGLRVALRLSRGPPSLISVCAAGWFSALIVLMWIMFWVPWNGFSFNAMLWFMFGLMEGAQRVVRMQTIATGR